MKKGETILSGLLVVFFSFMFYEAFKLHDIGRFGEVGSGFWPMLALGASVLLSLSWFIGSLKTFITPRGEGAEELSPADLAEVRSRRKKVLLSIVSVLAYLLLMPWIGFILSTLLFIPAFALALEERRKMVLILSPFLVTAIIVFVFAWFITLPFPKGVGIFAAFSRLFY